MEPRLNTNLWNSGPSE